MKNRSAILWIAIAIEWGSKVISIKWWTKTAEPKDTICKQQRCSMNNSAK